MIGAVLVKEGVRVGFFSSVNDAVGALRYCRGAELRRGEL